MSIRKKIAFLILCTAWLWPTSAATADAIDVVREGVIAWSKAWVSQDIERYMSFYSRTFRSKGLDYNGWRAKKTSIFQKKNAVIQVEISDLWVFIEGKHAIATFVQHYQNQQIKDFGKKTLVLENSNNSWKIISEEWKPLLMPDRMPRVRADAGADIEFNNKSQSIRQDDSSRKFKDSSTQKTLVNDINFQVKDNWEGVCIVLNKFSIPRVQAFEGDKPRIEIDILEVSYWNGDSRIPVNGKRIRQIRTSLNRDLEKLRVFLDLNPAEDYIINQTYLKSDNIYCIEVR